MSWLVWAVSVCLALALVLALVFLVLVFLVLVFLVVVWSGCCPWLGGVGSGGVRAGVECGR
ncbi:hypothetical protein [Streptomyces mirabilis]